MAGTITNFIDRTVAYFNPQAGVQRLAARAVLNQFDYDGAYGGLNKRSSSGGTLFRNASPESWTIQRDAIKLMWESRDMESNFCFYRGILSRIVLYAVGTIRWQSNTGDAEVDAACEKAWENWCNTADATGRHHLYNIVRLGLRGMLRDRDCGFALHDDEESGNLKVRLIEADRIGNPLYVGATDEKKIHGVMLDDNGAVSGYEIFKRSRTNMYEKEEELPPQQFLHLFDPLRYDQYRGIALFAPGLPHMRDLYEAFDAEMQAIKFAGSFAAFVKSATGGYGGQGAAAFDRDKNVAGENKLAVKPGTIQRLTQGEDMVFAQTPSRPSGAFMAFVETKIREICNGANIPFGFGWNLAALGGVTARIEVAQMKRFLEGVRELVRVRVLEPLKDKVLLREVAAGRLRSNANRGVGRWGFGADITGDVGYDTSADLQLLEAGIYSESYLVENKYGGDFLQHVQQQAREINVRRQVATDTGVPIELQTQRLPNATQMLAAMNTAGDPDAEAQVQDANAPDGAPGAEDAAAAAPPPSGLAATYGKDALKGLIQVMKELNLGTITRDQAVTTLVATYGMDLATAEQIIPK